MDDLQLFMYLYMYELEIWLNEHSEEILEISFQSDEANTDRSLKEFIKNVIETKCDRITAFSDIEYIDIFNAEGKSTKYNIADDIKLIQIENVLLPENITQKIKGILQNRKNAVFTKPDLCLELIINGRKVYETIELKSTKSDAIPGSSIQQISPEEWVIFIKHSRYGVEVTTGQYLNAINSKMQFPDRSPRPQVSFSELKSWNNSCRHDNGNIITYTSIGDETLKYELLTDWQSVLAKRWTKIVLDNNPRKREPWFNNNLRKFILEFLNEYDNMTPTSKQQYKDFLCHIIE